MTKDELRRKIRHDLAALSSDDRDVANRAIAERVQSLREWREAPLVLGYLAMRREASVDSLLGAALAEGKRVAVPTVSGNRIVFREIDSAEGPFRQGAYGIREPHPERPAVEVTDLEGGVLLVPGLGFDESGARLGRGGGYYDRLLEQRPRAVVTVGIAFAAQLQPSIPTDEHDCAVDLLVTDGAVYRFRPAA